MSITQSTLGSHARSHRPPPGPITPASQRIALQYTDAERCVIRWNDTPNFKAAQTNWARILVAETRRGGLSLPTERSAVVAGLCTMDTVKLSQYRAKRDFQKTSEPQGEGADTRPETCAPSAQIWRNADRGPTM